MLDRGTRASLHEIVRRVEVGTPYRHFPTRDALHREPVLVPNPAR